MHLSFPSPPTHTFTYRGMYMPPAPKHVPVVRSRSEQRTRPSNPKNRRAYDTERIDSRIRQLQRMHDAYHNRSESKHVSARGRLRYREKMELIKANINVLNMRKHYLHVN